MKISFLLHNAYGIGGTITTTFNLAGALAERHDVEIVSVLRNRDNPPLTLDPRVRVRPLVDLRTERDDPLHKEPARVFPAAEQRHGQYSRLTDERIARCLADIDADVVIGTRPGLNVHLALQAPDRVLRVGQEHLTWDHHSPHLRTVLRRAYRRLNLLTTVTEADARVYRRQARLARVPVQALPNSVPDPVLPPADGRAKLIVAAGRLVPVKGYDLLVRAFAKVAAEHPDWRLRVYGIGEERDRLRDLVHELGLSNNVHLMGATAPMEGEWVKASIGAASSVFEPFGMTIVEAMRCGLPVVSTDCRYGPGEIIRDGVDGRLVPPGDPDAFGAALLDLVRDDERRRAMGRAAAENARRYAPESVVAEAERLLTDAVAARAAGHRPAADPDALSHTLTGTAHAARDLAHVTAARVLRTLRLRGARR
ncbi:glycosyltransferase family 4 protein [Streptomyces sp. NPDC091385]|uniref:glycosyltransferase family 4 protein n=1 Tax=Streptomyces sp. NPDC091385 TaxID=3365997 RepID=UPI0037FBBAB0